MYYKQTGLHNDYKPALSMDPLSAALLAAALYFLELRSIAALAAAVSVHELGHLAALRLLGLRIRAFRSEAQGFCIDYEGETTRLGHIAAALAGPAAGLSSLFSGSPTRYQSSSISIRTGTQTSLIFTSKHSPQCRPP